jgi:hypothetical protein
MEAAGFCETSVPVYQITLRYLYKIIILLFHFRTYFVVNPVGWVGLRNHLVLYSEDFIRN